MHARFAAWPLVELLIVLLIVLLTGCQPVVSPSAEGPDPALLEQGRKVYNFRCYFCHGYSGDARTLAASYLNPPPRDFTRSTPASLPPEAVLRALREGRPGTAMESFAGLLSEAEMQAVAAFVQQRFLVERAENTRYHTVENGWPDHARNAAAFPFARGEIPLDRPWELLSPAEQAGKRLYLQSCVSCHDHGRVEAPGAIWSARPVSYPRDAYCSSCHQEVPDQAPRGAAHPRREATHPFSDARGEVPVRADRQSPGRAYRVHDQAPTLPADVPPAVRQGEQLFQRNCAFCHAADGTGKGWIGRFLEPHARDLTDPAAMRGMTRERLRRTILDGLPDSSMPGWRQVLSEAEVEALVHYVDRAFHPLER